MGPGSPSLSRGSAGTTTGSLSAEPTCGCRKRSPAPIHCFRIVIYNGWRNSNVSSRQRAGGPRSASPGAVLTYARSSGDGAREDPAAAPTQSATSGPFGQRSQAARRRLQFAQAPESALASPPASCLAHKKSPGGWPRRGRQLKLVRRASRNDVAVDADAQAVVVLILDL